MSPIVLALFCLYLLYCLSICVFVCGEKVWQKCLFTFKSELDNRNSRKQWSQVCTCVYGWLRIGCSTGVDSILVIVLVKIYIYFLLLSDYILFSPFIQNNRIRLFLLLECTFSCCCCCSCYCCCCVYVFEWMCVCLRSIVVGCSVCLVSLLIYYGRIWVALSYYFLHFSACPMYVLVVVAFVVVLCICERTTDFT